MRGATLWLVAATVVAATGAIVGCNVAGAQQQPAKAQPKPAAAQPKPGAAKAAPAAKPGQVARVKPAAGVPIQAVADPKATLKLMPTKTFVPRNDPFALMQAEREYEQKMLAQNLSARYGSFPMFYTEAPERVERPVMEPQPYRRLAAILVGESVTALIDMGDSRGLIRIRPGMRIPGTDWMVASIDSDKAVLRRVPGSVKRPEEVVVRLESPPRTVPTAQTTGGQPGGQPAGEAPPARTGGRRGAGGGGGEGLN